MDRLIICGGGHVSLEVVHMAARLEYEIIVIDDRIEFANPRRFPLANQVICSSFLDALDQLGSRGSDYYVILTRGHAFDRVCLERILNGRYAYVGMIGSKIKVAAVMKSLQEAGIPPKTLEGVHSPIGLSIGAQTPAEIAVSITAELVKQRAHRGPNAMPPPDEPGILCTIVKKSGSAPRGVGTWMHVRPDGTCVGTIGGGTVEYQTKLDALEFWAQGRSEARQVYDLTHAAAELGMVCGGKIEVSMVCKK
ncbi:XdhC family protein [Flavonifractor sp. DFI.6.63]|uniref:XdhC family protein n=1 Tax=Flavonifractor sp. DFI.6.63 TaxID=2963704 RepID=UPI00210D240E|nr:XdhC/CoxI family protein [Flavonifractor sp. DFI.6.63]MCQ5029609.1 XdhC family protein [Flavonifractor sp. DFI.6.63]